MPFIKNIQELATTEQRKVILALIEEGLEAIQPQKIMSNEFTLQGQTLLVKDVSCDLNQYERVFLIGFGKGSAGIAQIIEEKLGEILTAGFVIDNVQQTFSNIDFTLGTHPLPSQQNIDFTKKVINRLSGLTKKDLVLVAICGGGSSMFEYPYKLSLEEISNVYGKLIKSGATISEINVIRKHLSKVKGGGLAKELYPAKIVSLVFSDVPGDNLSTIASGPTTKDSSTLKDVKNILDKYSLNLDLSNFIETPEEAKYFENVLNVIMVSNKDALNAMDQMAKHLGYKSKIYSSNLQGDSHTIAKELVDVTKDGEITLAGGESTLKVTGKGKGGRNQVVVMSALRYIDKKTIIASFDSDGIDNYYYAGAIGDNTTVAKAAKLGLDVNKYLSDDNSYEFFKSTGDGIYTDKLESNVSDLILVAKI